MYKCRECGTLFEEPTTSKEGLGFVGGDYATLSVDCCPECGADGYFDEIEKCIICNEYSETLKDGFCDDCLNKVRKDFMSFWEDFTEEEQDALRLLNLVGESL